MWTFIKPISKDIQIGSNSIHIITKIHFPIQLVATQGLTLDHLAFDPNGVYKYGSTFTTFSHIKNKENTYLFQPLHMKNFQINRSVAIEMHQLQTIARWDVLIPTPHTLRHSHVFICFLTRSLSLDKNDVSLD
jgi:integrase